MMLKTLAFTFSGLTLALAGAATWKLWQERKAPMPEDQPVIKPQKTLQETPDAMTSLPKANLKRKNGNDLSKHWMMAEKNAKKIFNMRGEGKTYTEISNALGINHNVVRTAYLRYREGAVINTGKSKQMAGWAEQKKNNKYNMTDRELEAYQLREGHGMTYAEAGKRMGISRARVEELVRKAKKKIETYA